ncbi:unnamed protein product [Clavelina lepadiformis]|uniref:G-protein coupled receptors family 1 profile domain-containing protein n=1 Tax=Clavelina lepadiformis TaxID=159417 RepID=A0ABP0G7H9_CLALP
MKIDDVITLLLSCLVLVINILVMTSLIRNYRRLRQRMFLFVISLTAVDVTVGLAFISDVIVKTLRHHDVIMTKDLGRPTDGHRHVETVLEGLKLSSITLSCCNVIILTYALYKRTISMGRHRTDSSSLSSLHGEGASGLHRPGFETIMKVFNRHSSEEREFPRDSKQDRQKRAPCRRSSVIEYSSTDVGTFDAKSENPIEQQEKLTKTRTGYPPTQNKNSRPDKDNSRIEKKRSRTLPISKIKSTWWSRSSTFIRRGSVFQRSSHSSYIGRHSNSVVSIRTTLLVLFFSWTCFLVMWFVPLLTRSVTRRPEQNLSLLDFFVCPVDCDEQSPGNYVTNQGRNDSFEMKWFYVTRPISVQNSGEVPLSHTGNENTKVQELNGVESSQNVSSQLLKKKRQNQLPESNTSGILHDRENVVVFDERDFLNLERMSTEIAPSCATCSTLFPSLSKAQLLFSVLLITCSWIFAFSSALRLLWLRKHSSNVFVRCSALWRFIFFNAIFHLASTAPYVTLCVIDLVGGDDVFSAPLYEPSRSRDTIDGKNQSGQNQSDILTDSSSEYGHLSSNFRKAARVGTTYVTITSSFILLHCAIAPSLYIVRLLGLRRLLSGL